MNSKETRNQSGVNTMLISKGGRVANCRNAPRLEGSYIRAIGKLSF